MAWFRRRYGAGPIHLLALLACFGLAGYAATRLIAQGGGMRVAAWFVLCLVGHDLIAYPLYALADRTAIRASRRHPDRLPAVPWINHVRVPAVISGVLLIVAFPLVLRLSNSAYIGYTGHTESVYLGNWLLVTGVAFALSGAIYAARVGRARRRVDRQESLSRQAPT